MLEFLFKKSAPEVPQLQYRVGGRKDRMLKFFKARVGMEVPLPLILDTFRDIADPMRVIRYLRADGYDIRNREQGGKNVIHSFYTYYGFCGPVSKEQHYTKKEQEAYDAGYEAARIQFTSQIMD